MLAARLRPRQSKGRPSSAHGFTIDGASRATATAQADQALFVSIAQPPQNREPHVPAILNPGQNLAFIRLSSEDLLPCQDLSEVYEHAKTTTDSP